MPAQAALFWESYIQTYIERDLPGISAVASTIDYQSVMRMIAITTGSLLEYSSVANNTHVSSSTVARYVEILRTAHLLDLVPPDTSRHNFTCCFPGHCSVYSWYE